MTRELKMKSNRKINQANSRGGDGGKIFIFANEMKGDGLITVDGGDGDIAGAGGRVNIVTDKNRFIGNISAVGGRSTIKTKWWENSWIQLLALISAMIGIIGFVLNIYEN